VSCAPVKNYSRNIGLDKKTVISLEQNPLSEKKPPQEQKKTLLLNFLDSKVNNEVELILPRLIKKNITSNLINSFELSIYNKQIKNIKLNINRYDNDEDLKSILIKKSKPGKIFIGTLSSSSSKIVKSFCNKGILFFSFSSDKNLASECTYLVNFFPEDDIRALFNYFPVESKIAILYPENFYGLSINSIIDSISTNSKSLVISRVSYSEDLSNARDSIKELGKYKFRKNELNRQKNILKNKNDEISKKALLKIQKYETVGDVDFTHLILPDYSIRLLEIAALLPFYDVDPNKVQFVGTGVWDDSVFFDEPSLQGAIFPGIEDVERVNFFNDYEFIYKKKPLRTSTIPYDLMGILSYIVDKNMTFENIHYLLNDSNIKFEGIDGKFSFKNNIIYRDLKILKIKNGEAKKLN